SAAYELPVQAGARTELSEGVFELVHTAGAHAVWIVGSARARISAAEAIADGERAADEIVAVLGGPAPKESAR
ncbi:MAG: hypothetical protein K1X94_36430, partial [Sandaracinaceae bacterium]|nr:hypothetical protein [Sandaracinaceae bacterium]